jgi:hypothetical protein
VAFYLEDVPVVREEGVFNGREAGDFLEEGVADLADGVVGEEGECCVTSGG